MSNGPDCYVKGEGVVHKENGPALKKCRTCTEKLYFYVNKSIVVWSMRVFVLNDIKLIGWLKRDFCWVTKNKQLGWHWLL